MLIVCSDYYAIFSALSNAKKSVIFQIHEDPMHNFISEKRKAEKLERYSLTEVLTVIKLFVK